MAENSSELERLRMDVKVAPIWGAEKGLLARDIWPHSIVLWVSAFYLALTIIRPWEELFPALATIHFERVYALCMIAVVLLDPNKHFRLSFQTVTVILFTLAMGVSLDFAQYFVPAWDRFYEYLTFLVFYFVLILGVRTPYELMFIVTCYIVTMAAYLAKAQWEYFFHGAGLYDMGVHRLKGIESRFGSPNSLAMSIVVSLPIWLCLYSVRKTITNGWPAFWQKWFPRGLMVYLALAVSSIALTNSRSGMLSFVLFVLLAALRGRGVQRKLASLSTGLLLLLLIWLVLPGTQKNRFRTIWDPEAGPETANVSAQGRIDGYKAGMTMFKRYPISGVGIGNFKAYRIRYVDGIALNPHNLVGQVLGENGILGGLTFLLMVTATLVNCRRIRVLARGRSDLTLQVLWRLGQACRDAVILLAFEGVFGHNLRRFNWLWMAAFSAIAVQYATQIITTTPEPKPQHNAKGDLQQC